MSRLPHPASRLSPPPGTSIPALLSSAGATSSDPWGNDDGGDSVAGDTNRGGGGEDGSKGGRKRDDAPKRGYRACVHCRLRKAKCDLGDVNAPSEPPCSRCRREQRNCVFLPSKRRRKTDPEDEKAGVEMVASAASTSSAGPSSGKQEWTLPAPQSDSRYGAWPESLPPAAFQDDRPRPGSSIFAYPDIPQRPPDLNNPGPNPRQQDFYRSSNEYGGAVPPPSSSSTSLQPPSHNSRIAGLPANHPDRDKPPSITGTTPESTSTSALSPIQLNAPQRKRRKLPDPDETRRIVVANFSNETDALEILANAATDEDKGNEGIGGNGSDGSAGGKGSKKVTWKDEEVKPSFVLYRLGILDENTLWELIQVYFRHYHPFLPVFQTYRIPRSKTTLKLLVADEPFLMSSMVVVSSRHHSDPRMRTIHERTWALLRDAISDYCFAGAEASVGLVEGVLILAEFLPREKAKGGNRDSLDLLAGKGEGGLHGIENRRGWNLTGIAIRAAYGLGLDQQALDLHAERTPEFERARLAFTWCYLYDRTIDKTGLAFWSRGPSICFTGYSHISQTGEPAALENFPSMMSPEEHAALEDTKSSGSGVVRPIGSGADSASFIQALMELTQIMTNAHDTLYPNKTRTNDLVRQGGYFRFLDSFRRALDSFKSVWQPKIWQDNNLKELTWCTFEMVRLYISSFAFQAHVQRAWMRAEGINPHAGIHDAPMTSSSGGSSGMSFGTSGGGAGAATVGIMGAGGTAPLLSIAGQAGGVQLFPRGSATSPDALYIYASVDAAAEILSICLRLSKQGVLKYLPSRYLINFVFGGVFALKAAYSGAQGRSDLSRTRELVDRVCAALVLASPDRDHPAPRYGQMLRLLSKKLEELSEQSAVPSRFPSPEADDTPLESNQNQPWDQFIMSDLAGSGSGTHTPSNNNDLSHLLNGSGPRHGYSGSGSGSGYGQTHQHHQQHHQQQQPFSHQHSQHPHHLQDLQHPHPHHPSASGYTQGGTPNMGPLSYHPLDTSQQSHMLSHNPNNNSGGNGNGNGRPGSTGSQNGHSQRPGSANNSNNNNNNNAGGLLGVDNIFDFDVDINFNMEGFWDDFTLAEGSGFPFR